MKLTEEQLRKAALLAREKEISQFHTMNDCPAHIFSAEFEAKAQALFTQSGQGTLKRNPARMGWQYYAKRGIAAALIGFLLICIAPPEAVMAGCEKFVKMIETVFEELTEIQFDQSGYTKDEFVAAKLNDLPDDMQEVEHWIGTNGTIFCKYENRDYYFYMEQIIMTEENALAYILDTEEAEVENLSTKNGAVSILQKNGIYQFMLLHDCNLLVGDTNLPYNELVNILENIYF